MPGSPIGIDRFFALLEIGRTHCIGSSCKARRDAPMALLVERLRSSKLGLPSTNKARTNGPGFACSPIGTRTQICCLGGGYSILLNYGARKGANLFIYCIIAQYPVGLFEHHENKGRQYH